MLRALLLLIGLEAIGVPTWAVLAVGPGVEQLQDIADKACKCERRTGKGDAGKACWEPLFRVTRLSRDDVERPSGTTCFPLSTEMADLDVGRGAAPDYIVLRYRIVGSGGLYLCSRAEAVVGESIWQREAGNAFTEEESRIAYPRAEKALRNFALALKRGERLETLKPSMGCVTGYPGIP